MRVLRGLMALAMTPLALGACATNRVKPEVIRAAAMAALAQADSQVLQGCYACLLAARDTYMHLLTGPVAVLASARRFEAELLIVLREKELSIETSGSISRLREASAGLPTELDRPRILRLVDLIPPSPEGVSEAEYATFMREHLATVGMLDDDVDWLSTAPVWAPVREYLTLSLQCSVLGRPLLTGSRRWRDPGPLPDNPPLLTYRRAVCAGPAGLPKLEALREAAGDFAEAAFVLARTASLATERASSSRTRALAAEALRALPQSPAVTYLMATVEQVAGDCREALRLYTETLALRTRHEHAQLGRTVCLTYLDRPDEAIDAATTLVGWQSINLRDGFYWRAYNHHVRGRLDQAHEDIERSKQLGSTLENHTLAGIIGYERDDLTPALVDLAKAWSLGKGRNCTAA